MTGPLRPTAEQEAARDVFAAGRDLALIAGAGAGKTSTLALMGATTTDRGLYMAYNKAAAEDGRRRFGRNVDCRTSHSLAFQAVGVHYADRLNNSPRRPAKETARLLGLAIDLDVGSVPLSVAHQARLVMGMVTRFCRTADPEVAASHLLHVNGLDHRAHEQVAAHLLPYAVRAWEDIRATDGVLKFDHEHYMKMWGLSRPQLPYDFILLDEAQDTNPVVEEVFLAQDTQRVCVGDPAQRIYAWRNARDVMRGFPADHLHLTESFRFGPPIAEQANRWLRHAGFDMRLTGRGPADGRIAVLDAPDAVLCRGNADAMDEVLHWLGRGVPVALVGGGRELRRLAEAAADLKAGNRTSHPELFLFATWGEVQDYADTDPDAQDLRTIVHLIDSFGTDTIIDAVDRLSGEEDTRIVVSTAHKSKGREWNAVRIGGGFHPPPINDAGIQGSLREDEARLIYVAVTRARHALDQRALSWIDDYERHAARAGQLTRAELATLPLTGQLRHADAPVSRFMADHLPHPGPLHVRYLKSAATLPPPVQPIEVRSPDWSALGHAIDYRLRISLGSDLGLAVTHGVDRLSNPTKLPGLPEDPAVREAVWDSGCALLDAVDAHLDGTAVLGSEHLSRLCFVAASYEQIYRTGRVQLRNMLLRATSGTTLEALTAAVPGYAVEDLQRQYALSEEPFAAFRALPPDAAICGPTFAGSGDIGGADADFILDGLLLDCKSTRSPRAIGPEELRQLAGYLLLDYDDQHGIDRVGFYLSRQGALITWTVEEFLARQGATASLPVLRMRLRRHLRSA